MLELYILELPKALKYYVDNSQEIIDIRAWVAFLENPKEMINHNMPIEVIMSITKLTKKEIEKLM